MDASGGGCGRVFVLLAVEQCVTWKSLKVGCAPENQCHQTIHCVRKEHRQRAVQATAAPSR